MTKACAAYVREWGRCVGCDVLPRSTVATVVEPIDRKRTIRAVVHRERHGNLMSDGSQSQFRRGGAQRLLLELRAGGTQSAAVDRVEQRVAPGGSYERNYAGPGTAPLRRFGPMRSFEVALHGQLREELRVVRCGICVAPPPLHERLHHPVEHAGPDSRGQTEPHHEMS